MPVRMPVQAPTKVEFVLSETLDLLNAMEFTALARDHDGLDGWPEETRKAMHPDLRDELDALYSYPIGDPGIMGALQTAVFGHQEVWDSVAGLVAFVRNLDLGVGDFPQHPGIQGLAHYALRWPCSDNQIDANGVVDRHGFIRILEQAEQPVSRILEVYDKPEELRGRIAWLIERFYGDHYQGDISRRLPALARSVEAHRQEAIDDPIAIARSLNIGHAICFNEKADEYEKFIFLPSTDLGPYFSCGDIPPTHVLYYRVESRYLSPSGFADEATERLAQVYKALSDEQRLRILGLLKHGELYAQEIVERTGLHQSVVSRHLSFLKAVGLVNARRENNMKFYSLNNAKRDELARALDQLLPAEQSQPGLGWKRG